MIWQAIFARLVYVNGFFPPVKLSVRVLQCLQQLTHKRNTAEVNSQAFPK